MGKERKYEEDEGAVDADQLYFYKGTEIQVCTASGRYCIHYLFGASGSDGDRSADRGDDPAGQYPDHMVSQLPVYKSSFFGQRSVSRISGRMSHCHLCAEKYICGCHV